jgi:hypothetical protein
MLLIGLVIVLLLLVIWLATTSYLPGVLVRFVIGDEMRGMGPAQEGLSRWERSLLMGKVTHIMNLTGEVQQAERDMYQMRERSRPSMPVQQASMPVQQASMPVASEVPVAVAALNAALDGTKSAAVPVTTATSTPTPITEKFRTNLAHRFGSQHA